MQGAPLEEGQGEWPEEGCHPPSDPVKANDSAVFWRGDGSLRYVLRAIRVLHPILVIE
jgi:hypothetical protein